MEKERRDETQIDLNEEIKTENNAEKKPLEIATAHSFDELYEVLREKGAIAGSERNYDAETLIEIIEAAKRRLKRLIEQPNYDFRNLEKDIYANGAVKSITRTEALRFKVADLLLKEFSK